MTTITSTISKNTKSFSGGVDGVTGRGKKIIIQIGGTPETGDKFNVKLGVKNFGFVGKPTGRVVALATLKGKVYAASSTILWFCGIAQPTKWDTEWVTGAGFINMASEYFGTEELTGLGVYQNNLAVFARWTTQLWYVDPDPVGNRQLQVLDNIGTISARSVVSVGDLDVFFLSDTGIRSLRPRDSSNAAFMSDVGTPIDPLIISVLRGLTDEEKRQAVGVIEPEDGRYWLSLGGKVYAFSYFSGAKIAAWSTYSPPSNMVNLVVLGGRVYGRLADNTLFLYGGTNNETYDTTQVEAITPFLNANSPATFKDVQGIDLGIEGEWIVDICTDLTAPDVYERIAQVNVATYSLMQIPVSADTPHFKLRLRSIGAGYARLSNVAVHYRPNEAA